MIKASAQRMVGDVWEIQGRLATLAGERALADPVRRTRLDQERARLLQELDRLLGGREEDVDTVPADPWRWERHPSG